MKTKAKMWQLAAGRVTGTRPQSPYIFTAVLAFSVLFSTSCCKEGWRWGK